MAEDAARTEHRPRLGRGLAALWAPRAKSPVSYTHLTLPTILRV